MRRKLWFVLASTFLCALCRPGAAENGAATRTLTLQPFGYRNVTLDGGRMREQFDEVKACYMAIPNDNLLRGFRLRAGKPAPGSDMGGWYSSDTFNVFGQILSGLSRLYAASGDEAVRQKVQYLISEWAACIAPDGFFYYSANPNARHYVYDKMVGGLVDAYLYAGIPEALAHLDRITTWAEANLARSPMELGGVGGGATNEWYTLSENLYRAYQHTGQERYRAFGGVWEYTKYWDAYADKVSIFSLGQTWYHAYSHVNTLSGAAMGYRMGGSERYLDTLRNAQSTLTLTQVWATGGFGPGESLITPAQMAKTNGAMEILDTWANHFETQCGSWAIFKLSKYLISFTGEARYGDWIERVFWNGIGASIPMSASGEVQYYSHYHLGGAKKSNNMGPWTCCTGTRPQAVADYQDLVYFQGTNGLYVNLFTDSTARIGIGGTTLTVAQRTRFPEVGETSFTISSAQPTTFCLAIRSPQWLAAPISAKVNGAPFPVSVDAKGWTVVRRLWSNGDTLEATLPMRFRSERFPANSAKAFPAAIMYGPLVMGMKVGGPAPEANPRTRIDFANLASSFAPIPGSPLSFRLASDSSVMTKPYAFFAAGEKYFVYFDPAYPWVRVDHFEMPFSGWTAGANIHYTNTTGKSVEYIFRGPALRYRFEVYDDAGIAGVWIDGVKKGEVDLYAPWRGLSSSRTFSDLSPGQHTVRIEVLDKKNASSKGTYVNVAGLDFSVPEEWAASARKSNWSSYH